MIVRVYALALVMVASLRLVSNFFVISLNMFNFFDIKSMGNNIVFKIEIGEVNVGKFIVHVFGGTHEFVLCIRFEVF